MSGPTREQVRNLTTRAVRMTADDFSISGFSIPKDIEANITEKYEFIYYLVKFAQEQEREACAKVCEDDVRTWSHPGSITRVECAAAIRARGNT